MCSQIIAINFVGLYQNWVGSQMYLVIAGTSSEASKGAASKVQKRSL
jgi:hypothetical protein